MTMNMLREHLRPDETSGAQPGRLPVYWKTGTSWSFRDAWTAGVFGPYVLVVWVGNFDNSSNTAFVGVDAAAPLFFQIVDALNAERALAEPARPAPPRVKRVRICLASGDLPNERCPQQGWTWFIPGTSPIRVSTVHRPVVIDDATGRPACPPYDGKRTHTEVFEFWPSDLQQVFAQAGIPRRRPPQNPDCGNAGQLYGAGGRRPRPQRPAAAGGRARAVAGAARGARAPPALISTPAAARALPCAKPLVLAVAPRRSSMSCSSSPVSVLSSVVIGMANQFR